MKNGRQAKSLLDALWALFASVKLTVAVLLLLATTSVIGTLIPQNADPATYMRAFGEFAYRLMDVFDIFNMYYSWWFPTLIGVLTLNITVCTINRWPAIWKIVSSKQLKTSSIEKKQPFSEFSDPRSPEQLTSLYGAHVKSKYRHYRVDTEDSGFRLVAEKGRWTRLGVPVVHLSIVIILAGALVGSFYGFDGFINIPEGESTRFIRLRNSNDTLSLGFEVRCDDFDVSFYDSGSPKEFRSSLIILENGRKVIEKEIIVNDPLRYKGINFFQSSYGARPPENFQLSLTSANTGQAVQHKMSIGQSMDLPGGAGRFTARKYVRDYEFKGTRVGEALLGILEKPGNEPVEIALPLRFPTFDRMRKGEWRISVEGYAKAYYTGLQVTSDPGVPLVYTGFSLLLIGCWIAFSMSHKKIVVDVRTHSKSSRIRVHGTANRNRIGFGIAARKLGAELRKL